jgi:hypothetical protein
MNDMPSLVGAARERFQQHDWMCSQFYRAIKEVDLIMATSWVFDQKRWRKAADLENKIIEQLEACPILNGPH